MGIRSTRLSLESRKLGKERPKKIKVPQQFALAVTFLRPTSRNMESQELIRRVGEALYGEQWQRPLARELGVSDRLVRFWAAGDREIPILLPARLLNLIQSRGEALANTASLVEQFIDRGR